MFLTELMSSLLLLLLLFTHLLVLSIKKLTNKITYLVIVACQVTFCKASE